MTQKQQAVWDKAFEAEMARLGHSEPRNCHLGRLPSLEEIDAYKKANAAAWAAVKVAK